MAASKSDDFTALLQVNGKGWDKKLFISKVPNVCICQSCNNPCKDAVELGCDHEDNDIDAFCKECLAEVIASNNNQCPIDSSHKKPPIVSARSLRKQILSLKVYCPNNQQYSQSNDMAKDANIYDTLDEKEGGNIQSQRKKDKQHCDWSGSLKELISEHIKNCTAISDDIIMTKIKHLKQKIDEISMNVDKNSNECKQYNDICTDLQSKVYDLSSSLKQQQKSINDQFAAKDKQISGLSQQINNTLKTQQNEINNIKMQLAAKDDEMKKLKQMFEDGMDEKKAAEQNAAEPYLGHNSVVHDFDAQELINDGWQCVYDKPYKHATTTEELRCLCKNSDAIDVFVGGVQKYNKKHIILGAFGPSSVLHTITNSKTEAVIPYNAKNKGLYKVYWYHNTKKDMHSFGFSSVSKVNCCNADAAKENGNDRLSWYVTGGSGGYRLGTKTGLNDDDEYYKIIYVKQK